MDPNNPITSTQFCAFVKCRTKAYLLTQGEPAPESHFAAAEARISSMYKHIAKQQLFIGTARIELREFEQLLSGQKFNTTIYHIDCETAVYDVSPPSGAINPRLSGTAIPVLFVPWEKPGSSHNLLVCFGALAVSQVTGTVPDSGTLIFGDGFRRKTVKIASHVARTRQIIHAIKAASRDQKSPALILNRHCPICDFQSRCRGIATARDDLSLLTGMTEKERARCAAKGISTISQLSYGYRPRRRKRNTAASRLAPTAKNDHKLKALAIKKSQIHVVGTPSLKFEGVPIFLDVEGMPDRDFYYLIGLRFEHRGEIEERSFWADRLDGERGIWEDCLRTLKAIENALIISYGAYEIRFLKQMTERYVHEPNDVVFVDRLIKTSVNILSCIYGKVYFPTHSNSLKEVARYLGFEWRQPRLSGAVAPLVRRESELSANNALKFELIGYNMDDCRAATLVADAIVRICSAGGSDLDKVDVSSLEVGFQHTFGKLDCALPEFKKINDAAYWDYQRSKVYARTDKAVRRSVQKTRGRRKRAAVDKRLTVEDFPDRCPKCSGTRFWSHHSYSQVVFDLKFTRSGIKRWAVQNCYKAYRCSGCRLEVTIYARKPRFGPNLLTFIIYLLIELRLSRQKAADHTSSLFSLTLSKRDVARIKSGMAEKYLPTYHDILRQITKGSLICADETKGVVLGGGHYVWVFANTTSVAYVYAESRDSTILDEVLSGFRGVLVSDFYAAYESVPCAQQKCLIHLMRDINEDLHKNPFDDDLKDIATRFGSLLRQIVETIDAYGLRARLLGKHKKPAIGFIEHVVSMKYASDAGRALQKRIEKNCDRLFTFLDYDGVPWNNNNAEHAVRGFTRLRNAIGTSTPKGHREYATLLSIEQTLRYRGLGFLEFLQSGRLSIDR